MSQGVACRCKPQDRTKWLVMQYKCNHSAFNGYRWTSSDYSEVHCIQCQTAWRTKAKYVSKLKHFAK